MDEKRYYLPARPYGLALFRWYFGLQVNGLEHIPATGPVIIVPNHTSFLDPPLLSAVVPRVIYFLMLAGHYDHPRWHWLFRRLPCIPMERGSGTKMGALKRCLDVLAQDQVLCMFPEGGISHEHKAGGIKPGAALLALRAQAPIIPAGINGADQALPLKHRLPRRRPITINFGAPIEAAAMETATGAGQDKALLQEIMAKTMVSVNSLLTGV